MKKLVFLFTTIILVSGGFQVVIAQDESHEERRERYRAEKIAFLTEKLDLTPAEAQKFWPVYNEMEDKKWEIQQMRWQLENKGREGEDKLSDKEVIQLTRDFVKNSQKESDLYAKYNEEFLKVLPPKKVLRLYNAEKEFRMHMIKKYRDRHKNED